MAPSSLLSRLQGALTAHPGAPAVAEPRTPSQAVEPTPHHTGRGGGSSIAWRRAQHLASTEVPPEGARQDAMKAGAPKSIQEGVLTGPGNCRQCEAPEAE